MFFDDNYDETKEKTLKFKNIANLDLALLSGHFRGKLFKYLDNNKQDLVDLDELAGLDDAIWAVSQKYNNLINSDQKIIKQYGKAVVNFNLIDDIRRDSFDSMIESIDYQNIPKKYFK